MRDDLYHSVPQTHPWRRVVLVACTKGDGIDLVDAVRDAAWSSLPWLKSEWGMAFRQALASGCGVLFPKEHIESALQALERVSPTVSARRACEIAYASIQTVEYDPMLADRVVRATLEVCAEDGIEHAVSRVNEKHEDSQGVQLRGLLYRALGACDLLAAPKPKARKRSFSVDADLDSPLAIRNV